MSNTIRRMIPTIITFLIGMFTIFVYYIEVPSSISDGSSTIISWGTIIVALATGYGTIILLRNHVRKIQTRQPGEWIYSLTIAVTIFVFPLLYFIAGDTSSIYKLIYDLTISNIGLAVYAIVFFSLATSSYKAFRARNVNSTILLLAGLFVMLQIAPIGAAIWGGFPILGNWILNVPTPGAFRGINIAAAFGLIAIGFRTLLGYDRGHLGISEGEGMED